MKKFVSAVAAAKLAFLSAFAAVAFSSCDLSATTVSQTAQPTPTAAANANTNADSNGAAVSAQTADDNINRPRSEPYAGDLSIFEDAKRAENLQIDRVMDVLKITAGKSVADIGAGGGWFTVRAARRVGASGKVFAVEINQQYIDAINARAKRENFTNVQTILGTEDDPKLPDDSIDAVLILKTYHEIGQPIKVLEKLRKSLRKDALVGIIDRNGKGDDHGINKEQVVKELKQAGFALKDDYDFVKPDGMDYFLVFNVKN